MKKFINSKINRSNTFGISVIYGIILACLLTLILIFSSSFLRSSIPAAFLTVLITSSLFYYSKKYYDHNGIVSNVEKLSLTLLYVSFFEILCVYFGKNLFSLFFIFMPLVYAYGGRVMGILGLLIISAIELNLARDLSALYKLLPLATATVIFGSFIRGEQYVEGKIKKQISNLLQNQTAVDSIPKRHTTKDRIQTLIRNDLNTLAEFVPHDSIVLYLKNSEGLYEICDYISVNKELIDANQKLNFRTGYIGWTVKTNTPFMIGNIKNPAENITYYNREINIQSLLIIPICDSASVLDKTETQPNGILILDSRETDRFDNKHKLFASMIAERINSVLTIFRLQNTISESSEKLNSIYKYIQQLETTVDTEKILKNLFKTLHNSIHSDMICISLKKGGESKMVLTGNNENGIAGMIFSHSQSLMGIVSENNSPLNMSDISDRSRFRDVFSKEIDLGLGMKSVKSAMLFPISASEEKEECEIYGAVFFGNIRKQEFNEEQKNLAKLLIQQAAKSIKHSINLKSVKELAIKDGLSGLYNQSHFKEMLSNAIAKSQRFGEDLSLVLLDIDNFKDINDKYGHLAGDKIISEIGKLIRENLREVDISARYGGDEFAVLLEKTDPDGSKVAADKLSRLLASKAIMFNNKQIIVKLSIGIATCPQNAGSKEILIEKADLALYEAKRSGKNTTLHFNDIGKSASGIDEDVKMDKNISLKD